MLLATILLLGAIPQSGELAKSVANAATEVSVETGKDAAASRTLPSMPAPKAEPDGVNSSVSANLSAPAAPQGPHVALSMQPMKQAYMRPRETRGQRIAWYSLAVAGHGAAAFDAYSTRLALSGGYGTESNLFLRPFANSNAQMAAETDCFPYRSRRKEPAASNTRRRRLRHGPPRLANTTRCVARVSRGDACTPASWAAWIALHGALAALQGPTG